MEEALADFGESIQLCPWSPDPLLNRWSIFVSNKKFLNFSTESFSNLDQSQPSVCFYEWIEKILTFDLLALAFDICV